MSKLKQDRSDDDEAESPSDRIRSPIATSEARAARLASETGSVMEPDIKIDSPASEVLRT